MHVLTNALIPFSPEEVWAVLTNFDAYAEWNPLNVSARGRCELGARIPMTICNPLRPGKTLRQTVTIIEYDACHRLCWRGHIPLLFEGRHYFELEQAPTGTWLTHGEEIRGLITLTFPLTAITELFVPAYEAVNAALADRLGKVQSVETTPS